MVDFGSTILNDFFYALWFGGVPSCPEDIRPLSQRSPSPMILTVSAVEWRPDGTDRSFERTDALRPESYLELTRLSGEPNQHSYQVWVTLYFGTHEALRRLLLFHQDDQRLEWLVEFDDEPQPLQIALNWVKFDRTAREVSLMRKTVTRNLEQEIVADRGAVGR